MNQMYHYILESPNLMKKQLNQSLTKEMADCIKQYKKFIFIASGSSFNAAQVVKPYFLDAGVSVDVFLPGTKKALHQNDTLIIGISQTGTSAGVYDTLKAYQDLGMKILTITEVYPSIIQEIGDYYLRLMCGFENSNAKTKGYNATLLLLFELAFYLQGKHQLYINEAFENELTHLTKLAASTRSLIEHFNFTNYREILLIGSQHSIDALKEAQLKLIETTTKMVLATDVNEFTHGIHRLIKNDTLIILVDQCELNDHYNQYFKENPKIYIGKDLHLKSSSTIMYQLQLAIIFQVIAATLPILENQDPNIKRYEDLVAQVKTRYESI